MQAVDRELSSARAALEALATSPTLDAHDLRAFRSQAVAVLSARPGNVLVMSDASGRQIVNTGMAHSMALPMHGNAAGVRRVFETARPTVSDLYVGPTVNRLLSSVDVPVVRGGQVRNVLSMQYFGERLGAILARQNVPPGATITIYDGVARLVRSSRASRAEVGQRASATLAAGFSLGPEGVVDEPDDHGEPSVTVYSHSSVSNWVVAITLQRRALGASLWHSLQWIVLGAMALLALGVGLVVMIGTRIETAVRALVRPAIALGHGEQVVLPPLHLDEAKDVGHALVQTAALLRKRTLERDEAARAERALRDAKRVIERREAFLRGIFEQTPDGIMLVGQADRVTRANVQAERLFGYLPGALEGMGLDDLLVGADQAAGAIVQPVMERLRTAPGRDGVACATRLRGRRHDGSMFPVDAMANALPERALLIVTVRDVSVGHAQEEALRQALVDRNTLLNEVYHRVKNNLQLIISLFDLQVRTVQDPRAQQALAEAMGRVRAMALHDYIGELCDQLARAASAQQRGIVMELHLSPLDVGLDVAVPLGLLLNELVTNSLKHAFPDDRGGLIRVTLAPDGPSSGEPGRADATEAGHCLIVHDNGVGLPPDANRTSTETLGLRLVGALSDGLHARLTLQNQHGACITVAFRLPGRDAASASSSASIFQSAPTSTQQ